MTRTDSRRDRREQRQIARDTRRERLRALLTHADHGTLTPEDSAALRAAVEAEVAENETHRRSAGGHQAASLRLRRTLAAADTCLVETETDRDLYAARLAHVEQLVDTLAARLPVGAQQLVEDIRHACTGQAEQDLDATERR